MQVEGVKMTSLPFIVLAILVGSGHGQECQDVAPFGNFFIQQGSSFCVNCPVTGSSIQWVIDNVPVDSFSPPLNHTIFSNNSLIMRNSETGSYQCVNSVLTTHQFTVALAVDVPPFITDPTVYNETDNVRIICRSNAVPSPTRITWQRNNVTVGTLALLIFDSIQRSDADVYTCCTVRMVAGQSLMTCDNFDITVQYPPTITLSPPANSEAAVDTDHMIQCGFEGVPTPTVVWLHNGSMLTNGSGDITIATGNSSSTLTITTLAADDAGSYTCMVSNLLGNVAASSALTVQFPPDPPSTVMVTATTTTQISLSWINPFNGNSLITMATVTYQSTGGQNTTENANTITSHTITGLMPNMGYNIFLQSFNVIGASGSVSVTGMTMALPPNAPTVMLTATSSTMIRVTWMSGPANSSMTTITGWTVRYYPTGDSSDVMEESPDADDNEYVLTGLRKRTSYTVSVAASNSAGMGPFTEQSASTPADPPSGPTNLTATALSHSMVRVTWGPVSDNGGADVDLYSLIVVGPDLLSIADRQFPPDTTTDTIRDLVNNTHYRIYLSASNTRGFGPNVTTNVTTLDIGVPRPPELMSPDSSDISDVSVTVTWNELSEVEIARYQIEYRVRVDGEWMEAPEPSSATSNSYAITGLAPGTTYQVRIFAISTDGVRSVASNMITITTRMQLSVMIMGATEILFGETLRLSCVLSDGSSVPFSPQWSKDSGSLPGNATLEGTGGHILMIRSVISSDAGLYTCSNEGYSEGDPATVNVTIINRGASSAGSGLDTMEYVLIGIGGAILLGILILVICIVCVCCVRYRRRPKIYSPSKGGSNWIDGDGHTGIVFMASSYSSAQSPSQREETTDAPYLGCKEDDFHNASTFNTLERSAIHGYRQSDSQGSPQDNSSSDKSRAHYAELDLAPSSKYVPVSANSVQYAQVDKSSFKDKRSLSPPRTKAVPVPVEIPTAAAAKKQYDNPTYGMSSSYHYPVTPGDTVV